MTDTVVILNPAAGSPENLRSWQERVESITRGCPTHVTSHAGEAEALARDLLGHRGSCLVLVGDNQPPAVHALAHVLNDFLGTQIDSLAALVLEQYALYAPDFKLAFALQWDVSTGNCANI